MLQLEIPVLLVKLQKAEGAVKTEETFTAADWFIVKDGELYNYRVLRLNSLMELQQTNSEILLLSVIKSTLDMQISLLDTELTDIVLVKKGDLLN